MKKVDWFVVVLVLTAMAAGIKTTKRASSRATAARPASSEHLRTR